MKKQIPILFSTSMVQAIMAGRKSVTRRIVKPQPSNSAAANYNEFFPNHIPQSLQSPYGRPGDILYVREEYYQLGHWEIDPGKKTKGGRTKWKFVPDSQDFSFDPPEDFRKGRHHKDSLTSAVHKRLGRFMPRKCARIWLEVTGIRVERLQDITEADAIAEGVEHTTRFQGRTADLYINYLENKYMFSSAGLSFSSLWISINGQDSWVSNPWVWVVSFKILSTTGKPAGLEKEVVA